MSLIFAVDNDRKQSAALASLLRSHVNADLVQSGSATEGLDILRGRIPDLILTSSLLSPRDEAALATHLRELGDGAAHVHTLTIPVIATSAHASRKKPQGVLGGLRREKETRSSGCDPEVFAREVALYLDRAVERRASASAVPEPHIAWIEPLSFDSPAPAAEPLEPEDTDVQTVTASIESDRAPSAMPLNQLLELVGRRDEDRREPDPKPPPAFAKATAGKQVSLVEPVVAEPVVVEDTAPSAASASAVGVAFADAAEIAGLSARELAEISAPPRKGRAPDAVAAPEPAAPIVEMDTFEELDLLETTFAAAPLLDSTPLTVATLPSRYPVDDGIAPSWPWVDDQAGVPLADVLLKACGPIEEVAIQPEPEPEPEPEPAPTLDLESLEFIGAAAHRAGLHALESLAEPAMQAAPDEPAEVEIAPAVVRRTRDRVVKPERKRRQKTARPAQDEWGMFDPTQAGAAALFEDEDWEDDPEPPPQTARPRANIY